MKAIWNDNIVAESDETRLVEENHYFPMEDIHEEYFLPSNSHSRCPWKGKASYFHLKTEEKLEEDAAWYYPAASHAAKPIENYVAFGEEVEIIE